MFRFDHVCFEGFGHALPETVITSLELEQELQPVYTRFGLHPGRLELMTGIRERRVWDEGTRPSDGATLAARRLLAALRIPADQIGCLFHTAVSRDFLEPATATVVHRNLRLSPRALVYDISNACLGFLNGMIALGNMIELGQVKRGLIVAAESSRNLLRTTIQQIVGGTQLTRRDLKTALASLTIGSGAVAVVMAHDTVSATQHRLLGGAALTSSEDNDLCRSSADTGFDPDACMSMVTQSESLLLRGCELAAETWKRFSNVLDWSAGDIDRTFCHQVGSAHRDKLLAALGLDPLKDFTTFETLGNVGAVSLPLTMALGVEKNPPRAAERMALLGIGSGLGCIMLGVQW